MKILAIHASAGAGHMKAAEALASFVKKHTKHEVVLVDSLDYTPPLFKKLYRGTYTTLITKFPWLWGAVFSFLDIPLIQPLVRFCRRVYNKVNTARLEEFMISGKFDFILSTHFMSIEVVSNLKKRNRIKSKLIAVVTDFDVHRIWLASEVDFYSVATDWTKKKVLSLGVAPEKVFVTGIPTDEGFAEVKDVGVLKTQLGLEANAFTVLMATGSFGMGPIEETLKALSGFQVVVICGHNKSLYERLSSQKLPHVKICGLVNNMHDFMGISNVMVTKPGGLSIAEALVRQLPLVFFNPIPGQETNNINVLATYGVGVHAQSIQNIVDEVKRLSSSPDAYLTALKRTQMLARPKAASDIISLVV